MDNLCVMIALDMSVFKTRSIFTVVA